MFFTANVRGRKNGELCARRKKGPHRRRKNPRAMGLFMRVAFDEIKLGEGNPHTHVHTHTHTHTPLERNEKLPQLNYAQEFYHH